MEPINLTWGGVDYTIRPSRVMQAIAAVETVVTFGELVAFFQRGVAPPATLALAYGKLLRAAGAKVTDEEVYAAMFSDDEASSALDAVEVLLACMAPPADVAKRLAGKDGPQGDPPPGAEPPSS
jgi:hypothetical protein